MKKYTLVISSVLTLLLANSTCSAMTKDQVSIAYETAIKSFKTGPMQTFYDKAIDPNTINRCYKATADVKTFVNSHSKNLIGIKDSLLTNAALDLEKLTIDTINGIKITRALINGGAKAPEISMQANNFFALEKKRETIQAKVKKEPFNIADKKEAQEVLDNAFTILSALLETARASAKLHI